VLQAAVVPAVVTESATPRTVGRYTSAYQVTFSIGDIIVPAIVTVALRAGAATLWLPLSAVALLDLAAVALLARRMAALTQRVGRAPSASASQADRLLEADGIWQNLLSRARGRPAYLKNPIAVAANMAGDRRGVTRSAGIRPRDHDDDAKGAL